MPRRKLTWGVAIVAASLLLAAGEPRARGKAVFPGPVEVAVVRVIDGDTFRVRAQIWLDQEIEIDVRLRGVDAPELRAPACPLERKRALAARRFLADLLANQTVTLQKVTHDKFAGRIDADVTLADGRALSAVIIGAGHGVPYAGGRRSSLCAPEKLG